MRDRWFNLVYIERAAKAATQSLIMATQGHPNICFRLPSTEEAEKYVSTMEAQGRYQTETWS